MRPHRMVTNKLDECHTPHKSHDCDDCVNYHRLSLTCRSHHRQYPEYYERALMRAAEIAGNRRVGVTSDRAPNYQMWKRSRRQRCALATILKKKKERKKTKLHCVSRRSADSGMWKLSRRSAPHKAVPLAKTKLNKREQTM